MLNPWLSVSVQSSKATLSVSLLAYAKLTTGPNNISPSRRPDLDLLGASVRDVAPTIVTAYELQLSCDSVNAPLYLGALQSMERAVLPDVDLIALKVATESSMGKFSKGELIKP